MAKNRRPSRIGINLPNPILRNRRRNEETEDFSIEAYLEKEMLRFTTAGSVDDGKSTLIGRLLYDSKSIFQDQMETLEETSKLRGEENVNLALLTDGLRAEREQGITIDVAYRYFATPKRKFIIADTPGHEQYTRNMVTGASTADVAIILIDARKGVLPQSRRHGIIASLLGIPHLLVAVNKMDLVDWSQEVFDDIVKSYTAFSEKLEIKDIDFIPISALTGDNVVSSSRKMRWYTGQSVLSYLETVTIAADANLQDFRFPVQYVIRPNQDYRGFAGRIQSGTIHVGDEITVLPSGHGSKVKEIHEYTQSHQSAFCGQSVSITLEDEIDISRGDMIVRKENVPIGSNLLEATLCWMDESKVLQKGNRYLLQHTTRRVHSEVTRINYRLDINSLHREDSASLGLNEIGRVELELAEPLYFDSYRENRSTGAFILIDLGSNRTVAAGMIRHEKRDARIGEKSDEGLAKTAASLHSPSGIDLATRIARNAHRPVVFWLSGNAGDERREIGRMLEQRLFHEGKTVYFLDEQNFIAGSPEELNLPDSGSTQRVLGVGQIARILYDAGHIVVCNVSAPRKESRSSMRLLFPKGAYYEVQLDSAASREDYERDPRAELKFDAGSSNLSDIVDELTRLI